MKSAGYVCQQCTTCTRHKYHRGVVNDTLFARGWWTRWVREWESKGGEFVMLKGGCLGCSRVALLHALVLGLFLCRLEIEPDEERW